MDPIRGYSQRASVTLEKKDGTLIKNEEDIYSSKFISQGLILRWTTLAFCHDIPTINRGRKKGKRRIPKEVSSEAK